MAILLPRFAGGGAERVSVEIAAMLASAYGYECEIWATRFDDQRRKQLMEKGMITASPRDGGKRMRHRDRSTVRAVADMVLARDIDILVVAVSPLCDMPLLRELVGSRCRIIFHLHGQPFWELLPFSIPSQFSFKRLGEFLRRDLKERLFGTYTRRANRLYREMYDSCDACVVLCESYRQELERRLGVEAERSKVRAVYNPLPAVFSSAASGTKEREVLFVGRLTHGDKRVDRLIRIWARLAPSYPDWCLRIVGDGPERKALEAMATGFAAGNVSFEGYADPLPYYSRASIVAMTSTFEGWPGCMVEALATACHPIAFACSAGVDEILADERGTAVEPFDEAAYAHALASLMDSYPLKRDAAAHRWLGRLEPREVAAQWHELIESLL